MTAGGAPTLPVAPDTSQAVSGLAPDELSANAPSPVSTPNIQQAEF